ncbi:MAG: inositol monophosphatase [Ardenticatenaceae bacterium]|nr:inositol monophosphatase [Ardenticatenaceae bacterium]
MNKYETFPGTSELLAMAQETAVAAGAIIRTNFYQPHQVSSKGFRDLVTDTDFAAQAIITDAIRLRWPDHGFLTEEEDSDLPTTGPIIWVIDPVDGTINFSRGLPILCVSVAAVRFAAEGVPEVLAGVVYDPLRDELFSSQKDYGATMRTGNGEERPLHVSAISTLDQVVLTHDWSHLPALRQQGLACISQLAHAVFTVRAPGSAALALAWVAAGRSDAYFNFTLKPWDIAAGALLLAEAGGQLTDIMGTPLVWNNGGMTCLGSNGRVHAPIASIVTQCLNVPADK